MALSQTPNVTASLTLSSPNLINDALALTVTAKLNKAGASDSLDQVNGVSRKIYAAATTADNLFAAADYSDNKAHKLYIKNASTTVGEFINIELGSSNTAVGRLYAGEWAFLPWDGTNDVDIDTSAGLTIEYALFYEA
tara:strand:+ start:476 stop:889 length:414 start_codon:yes stop_codon:yes gene_type:complete